ncbi:divergent polysaccharide deacetylase family protein [Falsibacillus albus]|uniref:Divergent polysaccharide deacetylase family protein n=1 Tax=Falsibacillus albus TaxID=2478915 RepID=A0A3L7K1G1_9BACI|nr:divergent polysaccharide deacetylase family protein [Falsibacillus albus]RLQ96194.1 divergent polysaccharide deacetylase family protein [Falsibacillus albus]
MKKLIIISFLLTAFFNKNIAGAKEPYKNDLAIVIDDLGNNMRGTDEMLQLPVTLTVAIMPFLETTSEDAKKAHSLGHEVIVHMPMEPLHGKKSWLGPGAITTDLSDEEIRKRVNAAIDAVPFAIGMNHHMGSKATADERVMRIVLEVCKERGLYYLDSKTTGKTVIPMLAKEIGVPYLENELFFDDQYTLRHILKQANKLSDSLDRRKTSIAIGHVGISGMKVATMLKNYIPLYENKAHIVPLSELIPQFELINERLQ